MDFCRNVSVSGEFQQEQILSAPCSKLDDLFPAQNTEVDVSLEWLSIFVEDCLSSSGNCIPVSATATNPTKSLKVKHQQVTPPSLQKFVVPGKARSKRKRVSPTTLSKTKLNSFSSWSYHLNSHNQNLQLANSDPPLLQQTYWLADSELIVPKKEDDNSMMGNGEAEESKKEETEEEKVMVLESKSGLQQPRRCTHCLAQRTPQWRAGPLGPKTLCNACGVRYKSGRLLPEYRPAKSPTFVSYLHSNSHKKVMEMRMSSIPSEQ
ncbi:hypothetical protein REPUB_Repub16aG0127500 [Reevesia pubescens]